MRTFEAVVPTFVFGRGTVTRLGGVVPPGSRVLVVTTARLAGRWTALLDAAASVEVATWSGEPTIDAVDGLVARHRGAEADVVVGAGGGSVLDTAKALAGLLPQDGAGALDFLEVVGRGRALDRPPLRLVALPTTAGTGSEMTANAVLDVPDAGRKVSLRDRRLVPSVAIVDPELGAAVPRPAAIACGLDAAVQLVEAAATPQATPFSDLFSFDGARLGLPAVERLVAGSDDEASADDLALAASWSGAALANARLGTVHGFAGVVGGLTALHHGALCGLFAAPVLRRTIAALRRDQPHHPSLDRYGVLAAVVAGPGARPEALVEWFERQVSTAAIDRAALRSLEQRAGEIAAAVAVASSTAGNPVPLDHHDLAATVAEVSS